MPDTHCLWTQFVVWLNKYDSLSSSQRLISQNIRNPNTCNKDLYEGILFFYASSSSNYSKRSLRSFLFGENLFQWSSGLDRISKAPPSSFSTPFAFANTPIVTNSILYLYSFFIRSLPLSRYRVTIPTTGMGWCCKVSKQRLKSWQGMQGKKDTGLFLGFYFHVKVANDLDSSRYVTELRN